MKATLQKDPFDQALRLFKKPLSGHKHGILPVLSNVLVEIRPDEPYLYLTATNLDTTLSLRLPADDTTPGRTTVHARTLADVVNLSSEENISLSNESDTDTFLQLRAGRSRTRLATIDADEFPAIEQPVTNATTPRIAIAELLRMVECTAFAASTEETRPILNGLLWKIDNGVETMVATNGHRLSLISRNLNGNTRPDIEAIVPANALSHVLRPFDPDSDVAVQIDDNFIAICTDDAWIKARLIEGPYPNYASVFPTEITCTATVARDDLATTVKRVAVIATTTANNRVKLHFTQRTLTVSADTPDLGNGRDELPIDLTGDEITIAFNASYLLRLLQALPDGDLTIEMSGPNRAAILTPVEPDPTASQRMLIMPLRLID